MARERRYNDYSRPPMARNKWGFIQTGNVKGGSSLFGSNESAQTVVAEMYNLLDFMGATRTEDGQRGLVPAPVAGENLHFLQGNGGWTDIPAYRWLKEWPEGDGLEKSGLTIDGDFNVGDTLTTMNLEVQGAANFWTLIIDEVKAAGGQLIVSPSVFHIDAVGGIRYIPVFEEDSPMYPILTTRVDIRNMMNACRVEYVKTIRLYQRNDDGSRQTENECQVGDMMRCRQFNVKAGVYHNISNKDYWTFVCDTGEEEYRDEDNNLHKSFYIDVAYGLRLQDGHNLPLGTKLKRDGTYELPEGYVEITNGDRLKEISQTVYNGDPNVEKEYFDQVEYREITKKVMDIRGIGDQLNDILH